MISGLELERERTGFLSLSLRWVEPYGKVPVPPGSGQEWGRSVPLPDGKGQVELAAMVSRFLGEDDRGVWVRRGANLSHMNAHLDGMGRWHLL